MRLFQFFTLTCLLLASTFGLAQDANLKKILSERLPSLPKIEEISKTPMPGVFEIRVQGNEIFYADAKGDFLNRHQAKTQFDRRAHRQTLGGCV